MYLSFQCQYDHYTYQLPITNRSIGQKTSQLQRMVAKWYAPLVGLGVFELLDMFYATDCDFHSYICIVGSCREMKTHHIARERNLGQILYPEESKK